jgi:hypothetical protein
MKSWWSDFWFKDAPYFDLAVLRLVFVSFQCFFLLDSSFGSLSYFLSLPQEMFHALPTLKLFLLPWGWQHAPDADVMYTIFWVTVFAGMTSFIGLLTPLSMLVFAVGNVFIQAFLFSFGDMHHPEAIMNIALLAVALGPSGKVLSVDSWISQRLKPGNQPTPLLEYSSPHAYWSIRFLQCFFPLMYLSAVFSKLTTEGAAYTLDWPNGFTLQYYLILDHLRKGGGLGIWVASHHTIVQMVQFLVLTFQATFFLVVFFPRLRWIYLPLGLMFHIGIYLTLQAPFPQWLLVYAVYVPWAQAIKWLAVQRVLAPPLQGEATKTG